MIQWVVKFTTRDGKQMMTQPFSNRDSAELAQIVMSGYAHMHGITNIRVDTLDKKAPVGNGLYPERN